MRFALFLVVVLAGSPVAAEGVTCNANGAVVTLTDGTIYYLGKSCDVARKGGGEGKWWLTASAFAVEINGQSRLLPVEVDCPALPYCTPQ